MWVRGNVARAKLLCYRESVDQAVITGVGVVSPNAQGWPAFRRALVEGRSGVRRIELFDPGRLKTRIAGQALEFDAAAHLPAGDRDLRHISRAVPMALAASGEAMSDAGLAAERLTDEDRRRFGVCIGSGGGPIDFSERQYEIYFGNGHHGHREDSARLSVYNISSSTTGTLGSEISIHFGLRGLSHVISDGCTSSSDAIGYALHHIRSGRLDRVLTGGVDATITPGIMAGFDMMRVLAARWNDDPARASRPFDAARDGFVLGEGAWMFVLERADLALGRDARIYGEIRGYGATCEAHHRVKLKDPAESARAMRLAVEDANLTLADIGHIQVHGTSTRMNDAIETEAVKAAFGPAGRRIPCSSVKSMIGHPQGASGAAGLAAALLPITDGVVSPTVNLDEPDPACDLDYVPNRARKWRCDAALVNTLAFGSKNAALIVSRHVA
ncbi:MAG: hypothetical protein A3G34_10010 [Candidatus Lindowbacteria bacterium RIFCSPLOWO2_12_FULL_62_27]|nr:MAG: hypothetical protein A3G34_10010 [Candidatus Lindowbacteria bacterium RIFCSPLOWO2_12_FULL_62_27]OGH61574.1 MAG: hypothetical protein A3I06_03020 [Candidatus Lindowbacteria bacterium RIFCSPLOWO2_02_FULL_62_12]